jgi:predicted transposase/invertase (TIGR01784 family)
MSITRPRECDNLLKYLAEHYPAALASWLLGKPVTRVRILKTELSLQPIRADSIYLLETDDEILHVEFETDPTNSEPPVELRMLDYFVRVYRRERKLVRQVVIVLAETKARIPNEFHVGDTWHRYRVVKMWEQDPEPLLEREGLWPLAVLARADRPDQLLMEVAEKVSKIADEGQRNDLTAAVGILAGLRFDNSLIRSLFRREIMMQSVVYREILQEGEQIGEQRGIQIGEQQGRLAVIQKQLTHRFGVIPAETQAQLSALSTPELDELSEALLGFESMDDLARWLEQIGEQRGERHGRLAVIQKQLAHRFGVIPAEMQAQLSALSTPELDELSEALLGFDSMDDLVRWLEENRQ